MAKKGKYTEIEQKRGKPMRAVLLEMYAQYEHEPNKQERIAQELGVSQGTVSLWLIKCGLRPSVSVKLVDTVEAV